MAASSKSATRFLLILVVASTLFVSAYWIVDAHRQEMRVAYAEAVRKLEDNELHTQIEHVSEGSSHEVVFTPYTGSGTDQKVTRILHLTGLESLVFDRVDLTDEGLRWIAVLPQLKCLKIIGCRVSDPGLQAFSGNATIETLVLANTNISNNSLAVVATFTRLNTLAIFDEQDVDSVPTLTIDGLSVLGNHKSLQSLQVGGQWVTNNGNANIRKLLGNVKVDFLPVCPAW